MPKSSDKFCHSDAAESGLDVVLEGRVRLLDQSKNLVTILGVQTAFSENTLFLADDHSLVGAGSDGSVRLWKIPH